MHFLRGLGHAQRQFGVVVTPACRAADYQGSRNVGEPRN
jgi:hypothetical protein